MGQPSRQYSSAYLRLRDMQANIVQIKTALTPITFEEFAESWILYSAIERGIERISEASRGIPEDLKALHPEIPWKKVAGIGNILRHDYEEVSLKAIWDTAQYDFPELEQAVAAMLDTIEQQSKEN